MRVSAILLASCLAVSLAVVPASADPPRKSDHYDDVRPGKKNPRIQLKHRLGNLIEDVESLEEIAERLERSKLRRKLLRRLAELRDDIRELKRQVPRRVHRGDSIRPKPPIKTPVKPAGPVAMADDAFKDFLGSLKKASFSRDKLELVSLVSSNNWFTIAQASQVMDIMSFDKDKLSAVRHLNPHLIDRKNQYKLYEHFKFSSSKKKLKGILKSK
jgi:hypothetical protein